MLAARMIYSFASTVTRRLFARSPFGLLAGCLVTTFSLGLSVAPALADPQALSTFVPVQTQDALVVRTGTLELQEIGVYTRDNHNASGRNLLNMTPTLKVGAIKGLQIDVSAPYAVGDQSSANQGGGTLDAIYNFNPPTPHFPALGIQPGYQVPDGAGDKSAQYFLRGLATQWLGDNDKAPRMDLNLNWTHIPQPSHTGRRDILEISVAYSQLISDRVAFVTDLVHGAKPAMDQNETIVDAGLRWEIDDAWTLSGGVGIGIDQQSPPVRVIFAIQRDFNIFWFPFVNALCAWGGRPTRVPGNWKMAMIDGQPAGANVKEINRLDGIGDIENWGLRPAETKQSLAMFNGKS
jgi:hypothetical protein